MRCRGRAARVVVAAALVALVAGPAAVPARAALAAVGVADSLTTKHDRVAVVPAPGVLGKDLNLLVMLQTIGALAWVPAVRRLRDAEDAPR